jgi:deazaflavin-dependent oxidoreductase (nitroreductase family)
LQADDFVRLEVLVFDLVATLGRTPNAGIDREDRGVDKQQTLTFNDKNISEFRTSHGRIASFGDAPLLLLTTAGARSGQRRTGPMMYLADEHDPDRVYVFASYAGADQNPAWFHNVVAHPDDIEVELGGELLPATAKVLSDPRRAEVYATKARPYPGFAGYQEKDVTGDPGDRTQVASPNR